MQLDSSLWISLPRTKRVIAATKKQRKILELGGRNIFQFNAKLTVAQYSFKKHTTANRVLWMELFYRTHLTLLVLSLNVSGKSSIAASATKILVFFSAYVIFLVITHNPSDSIIHKAIRPINDAILTVKLVALIHRRTGRICASFIGISTSFTWKN